MDEIFKDLLRPLASNIQPVSIILFFVGFILLILGLGNGFNFAGLTSPAPPNDSYRGIAVLLGVAAMIIAGRIALKKETNKTVNLLGNNSLGLPRKTANELEREVLVFMMDIFQGKFETELQTIANHAINEHTKDVYSLCTNFLHCLIESKYLGELYQATIFQLDQTEKKCLFVADSFPPLPDILKMKLLQNSSSLSSDTPKGFASIAFVEQVKVKIYYKDSNPYLLEAVCERKANERMDDFIELKAIHKQARLVSPETISVAIPILHHKWESNSIGVFCIDGTSRDQLAGKENDYKLDQVARLISVLIEIQSFFNDLSNFSTTN